jgi:hypothetical protein
MYNTKFIYQYIHHKEYFLNEFIQYLQMFIFCYIILVQLKIY